MEKISDLLLIINQKKRLNLNIIIIVFFAQFNHLKKKTMFIGLVAICTLI